MPFDNPGFPMQFLVSRALAQKENVDDATATRLALAGTMLAPGLFGAIIARQLAIREAPPAVPVVVSASPATPTITGQVDRVVKQFQAFLDADKKVEADARDQAAKLVEQAQKRLKERTEALGALVSSLSEMTKEPPAKPTAAGK